MFGRLFRGIHTTVQAFAAVVATYISVSYAGAIEQSVLTLVGSIGLILAAEVGFSMAMGNYLQEGAPQTKFSPLNLLGMVAAGASAYAITLVAISYSGAIESSITAVAAGTGLLFAFFAGCIAGTEIGAVTGARASARASKPHQAH